MRETKFRVYEKDFGKVKMITDFVIKDGKPIRVGIDGFEDQEIDGFLVQYTGHKDRNDKEIFEGDILKYTDRLDHMEGIEAGSIGHVKWSDSEIGYKIYDELNDEYYSYDLQFLHEYGKGGEIIGNIHENPELLK